MSRFDDTIVECDQLDTERIYEVYRELPRRGCLRASVDLADLSECLRACEQAGFFGLVLEPAASTGDRFRYTAWKGKSGLVMMGAGLLP